MLETYTPIGHPTSANEAYLIRQMEQTLELLGIDAPEYNSNPEKETQRIRDLDAKLAYGLGKIYYDKADLKKAMSCFERSLQNTEMPRDFFTRFKILGFLVRICSERMMESEAQKYIDQSKELVDEMGKDMPTLSSEYFYNQATVYKYLGQFEDAREYFMIALGRSKEENDPNILAKCLHALGKMCFQFKEYQQALNYLNQLSELLHILRKTYILGAMHLLQANIYSEIDQFDKASEHFFKATTCFQKKLCWNQVGHVLLGQGILFKKMGDFQRASWCLNQALSMVDVNVFRRLSSLIRSEVSDLNDSNVDIYLDKTNRLIFERDLGTIDFKHRFVLLEILFLMAQNAGRYFDKERLAQMVWKDEYNPLIHDKLIYTSVSRLRKLIEPTGDEKRKYILRGKDGYTFNPAVKARFHRDGKPQEFKTIGNVDISSPV